MFTINRFRAPIRNQAWAEHNARVARNQAIHRELESTFPQKFKHPKIGREYMTEHGLSDWRDKVKPAIFDCGHRKEPPIFKQIALGLLIATTFLLFCFV